MPSVAEIDRRVSVIECPDQARPSITRISDLRAFPYVVLLGEPGIGKSIVLEAEAGREGAVFLTVRELLNNPRHRPGDTLFLDALDEYRTDGSVADKAYGLGRLCKVM